MTRSARGLILILILTAVGIIVSGLFISSDLHIVGVSPHIDSAVLEMLEVRFDGVLSSDDDPVFTVEWAGNPQLWREFDREILSGQTNVLLIPDSPVDIPPVIRTVNGELMIRPFRVKVNRSGESLFSVSAPVSTPRMEGTIRNSRFRHWSGLSQPPEPLGWHASRRSLNTGSALTGPISSDQGFTAAVTTTDNPQGFWIESSIHQTVPSLARCYEVVVEGTNMYMDDELGRPVTATGIQISQGRQSVWWVLSDEPSDIHVVGDVTVIEVPANQTRPVVVEVDLDTIQGDPLREGSEAVIKLFNATSLDLLRGSKTLFESIRPRDCSGG